MPSFSKDGIFFNNLIPYFRFIENKDYLCHIYGEDGLWLLLNI